MAPKTTLRLYDLLAGLIDSEKLYIHGCDLLQKKKNSDQNQQREKKHESSPGETKENF